MISKLIISELINLKYLKGNNITEEEFNLINNDPNCEFIAFKIIKNQNERKKTIYQKFKKEDLTDENLDLLIKIKQVEATKGVALQIGTIATLLLVSFLLSLLGFIAVLFYY